MASQEPDNVQPINVDSDSTDADVDVQQYIPLETPVNTEYGDQVELEPEEPLITVPVIADSDVDKTPTSNNEDYEMISSYSKRTSIGSDDKDKTPTPPEIHISPATTTIDIPEIHETSPASTSTVKYTADDNEGVIQPAVEGIWARIVGAINAFVGWVRWVLGH